MAWQMPGQWNTGVPQMTPDMSMGTYSAEQWAAVQQQNWHQWSQWQQQYSQWQSQYGEKYAEQMQSMQGMSVVPPLPPATAAPPPAPPPPEKPPPPPHENNQPLFGQPNPVPAPVPQPQKPLTATSNNVIPTGDTGNTQKWPQAVDARNESSQQGVNTEALKKLAEEERLFDIQFEKWEEEIEKWKRENVNHPDRQAYNEYEQKFETCRAQLLERRQVMNQKRARLLGQAAAAAGNNPAVTGNTPAAATSIQQTPNTIQNLHVQSQSQKPASEQTSNQYQQQDHSKNNYMPNKMLHQNYQNKPPPNYQNKPPPNYQDNSQYTQYNKNMQLQSAYNRGNNNSNDPQSGYNRTNNNSSIPQDRIEPYYDLNSQNEDHSSSNTSHTNFLPGIDSAKGIPGLDLVPEDKPAQQQQQPDVIDITDEISKAGQLPPDYTNISKGINNILGDEKIMNILSMVRDQGVPPPIVNNQGQYAQKPPYNNNADNYNAPPNNQWDRNQNRSNEHHENAPSNMPFNHRGPGYPHDQSRDHNAQQYPPPRRMNNDNENDWSSEPCNDKNAHFSGQNMQSRGPLLRPNMPPPRPLMQGFRGFPNDSQFPRGPPNGSQSGHPSGPRSGHPGGYPGGHSGGPTSGHPSGPRSGHPGGPLSGHPSGQPSGPRSGHPGGLPSGHPGGHPGGPPSGHAGGPPSGHPGGPPSGHPGGPPSGHPGGSPSGPPSSHPMGHPSGPRSIHPVGPPSGHTSGPSSGHPSGLRSGPSSSLLGAPPSGHLSGPPSGHPCGPPNGPSSGPLRGPPGGQAGPQRDMRSNMPPPRPLMQCLPGQDNENNYSIPPMHGRLDQEDENNYSRGPPGRPMNNNMVNPAMNKPPPPAPPPARTWSEDPQIAPSIIVDYQHKPLRLKAREFIEPVHIFEYNHISKDGDNNKKKFLERDTDELFVRKPRRFEPEDNYRDKRFGPDDIPRQHIQRDYERRYLRDDYREEQRDLRGPPREEYDDRRRFEERPPPREEYYDRRRFDDRGPPPREEFDDRRRLEERHDDRRRDDRERYSRREDFSKDIMRRDDREREREDLGPRDRQRELRRDDSRNRSRSRDKDSRKRGRSKEVTVSESTTAKKTKEPEKKTEVPKHIVMIDDLLEPPGREMRPEKIVIILRGPPGSGKSYLAKLIRDREAEHGGTARIMSIDDYFMQEGETEEKDPVTGKIVKKPSLKYEYEAKSEETYLNSLKRAFKRTLTDGYFNFLIYDTANETLRSYADIWNYARQNGFQVYICTMELDVQTCFKRNIHGRTLGDIQVIATRFFETPDHHIQLDATTLLQSAAITDVQMEDIDDEVIMEDAQEPEVESSFTSKWEKLDDAAQLARLDGTSKPLRPSQPSMEDYLQLDDWKPTTAKPGKKTVRWADIEESREQEKMRAIGFVVGQTDWNRMTDPTMGSGALTQTKYIERVKRN